MICVVIKYFFIKLCLFFTEKKKIFILDIAYGWEKNLIFVFGALELGKVYREVFLIENHNLNFSRGPSFVQFFVGKTFEVFF